MQQNCATLQRDLGNAAINGAVDGDAFATQFKIDSASLLPGGIRGFQVILGREIIIEQLPLFFIFGPLKQFQLTKSAKGIIVRVDFFLKGFYDMSGFIF